MNEFTEFQKRIINLYIHHHDVVDVWKQLDARREYRLMGQGTENHESPLNLFVMGKSRVGKSLMMRKYAAASPRFIERNEDGEFDVVPVVYMDLPTPFTLAGLYNQIIEVGLNAPRTPGKPRIEELKRRAFKLLKIHKVEMLIIDELDYLLASAFVGQRQAMEQIKNISNEAGVILVCVGTPAIEELRTLNDQYIGRYPPIIISRFKEYDDAFIQLLERIEKDLNLPFPIGLSDREGPFPKLLHYLSGGLMGWLKPILTEAFRMVGVFDKGFNDFAILNNIDGNVLLTARTNVIGQLSENEIEDFLNYDDRDKGSHGRSKKTKRHKG